MVVRITYFRLVVSIASSPSVSDLVTSPMLAVRHRYAQVFGDGVLVAAATKRQLSFSLPLSLSCPCLLSDGTRVRRACICSRKTTRGAARGVGAADVIGEGVEKRDFVVSPRFSVFVRSKAKGKGILMRPVYPLSSRPNRLLLSEGPCGMCTGNPSPLGPFYRGCI